MVEGLVPSITPDDEAVPGGVERRNLAQRGLLESRQLDRTERLARRELVQDGEPDQPLVQPPPHGQAAPDPVRGATDREGPSDARRLLPRVEQLGHPREQILALEDGRGEGTQADGVPASSDALGPGRVENDPQIAFGNAGRGRAVGEAERQLGHSRSSSSTLAGPPSSTRPTSTNPSDWNMTSERSFSGRTLARNRSIWRPSSAFTASIAARSIRPPTPRPRVSGATLMLISAAPVASQTNLTWPTA